ncbi:MRM2 rRNA methyltransferase 2 [Candida maltosa Xu316]
MLTTNSFSSCILRRHFSTTSRLLQVETVNLNIEISHHEAKLRKDKVTKYNNNNLARISQLDRRFNILNKSQTKIIDLGFVPGNWIYYIKNQMAKIHGVEDPDKIYQKCHILGFDILFGMPPPGVSCIQGNIFSKMAHQNIINHFREIALLENHRQENEIDPKSYFLKEQDEDRIDKEIIKKRLMSKRDIITSGHLVDLIVSDLGKPGPQQSGFYNYTETNPYLRYNNNAGLNHSIVDENNANFDFMDAALLLSCNILKPGGRFVARCGNADPNDPETELLHDKLTKVFHKVIEVNNFASDRNQSLVQSVEKYYICDIKKQDNEFDIYDVFRQYST